MKKELTAKDTMKIISKQWCNSSDFMKLSNTGRNTTLKLKRELKEQLIKENYFLPNNSLPMYKVVEKLKISIPYLQKVNNFLGEDNDV